jgi:hypothetical protein
VMEDLLCRVVWACVGWSGCHRRGAARRGCGLGVLK